MRVDVVDPYASAVEVMREYGLTLSEKPENGAYDAVVVAVSHRSYLALEESDFKSLMVGDGVLADVKGLYRGRIHELAYWSL